MLYRDSYIPHFHLDGWEMNSVEDDTLMAEVEAAEAVVVITYHKTYNFPIIVEKAGLIVDTRNALGPLGKINSKVVRL